VVSFDFFQRSKDVLRFINMKAPLAKTLFLFGLLLALSGASWSLDSSAVIGGEQSLIAYLNVGTAYRQLMENLAKIDIPESGPIKEQLQNVVRIALANFTRTKGRARVRLCTCNQRILMNAIDRYNVDHATPLNVLDYDALTGGKYLMDPAECPDKGKYSIEGDLLKHGEVSCSIHGSVAHPKDPSNGKNDSTAPDVFSPSRDENRTPMMP